MNELPLEDERVKIALSQLMVQIGTFVGQPLTSNTIYQMRQVIEQTRSTFKKEYQHDLPPLVPFILPSSGFICWYRQDLDNIEIKIKILNLLREFSVKHIPVSEFELAQAIKLTWPKYCGGRSRAISSRNRYVDARRTLRHGNRYWPQAVAGSCRRDKSHRIRSPKESAAGGLKPSPYLSEMECPMKDLLLFAMGSLAIATQLALLLGDLGLTLIMCGGLFAFMALYGIECLFPQNP